MPVQASHRRGDGGTTTLRALLQLRQAVHARPKYKHLFDITAVNDYDNDTDVDNSLLMMIRTEQSRCTAVPPCT